MSDELIDFQQILDKKLGVAGEDNASKLFETDNIKARSDVSDAEISYATRLYYLSDKYKVRGVDSILSNFLTLRLSRKRKSRGEFIKAISEKIDNFKNMFGGFGQR